MSQQKNQPPQKPAAAPPNPAPLPPPEAPVEVLTKEESAALATAPAAATALAPGRFDAGPYEARIAAAGEALKTIAAENPELREKLEELALYAVARVEGIAGDRGVQIPNVSVRQQMTKSESLPGDVKVGELYTKQKVIGPELVFVPLYAHFKRVRFVQGQDRPECYSDDGVIGSKWGVCARCAHGRYVEGERAGCSSGYAFSVVSDDFTNLYQIDFIKTSSKTGKRLMNLASSPHGIFKYSFRLSTEKVKNAKGEFYELRVGPAGGEMKGPNYHAARALSKFFEARFEMGVERRRAGGGAPVANNAGGVLTAGAGGESEPNFADEGV